jgi:hypothetical protein
MNYLTEGQTAYLRKLLNNQLNSLHGLRRMAPFNFDTIAVSLELQRIEETSAALEPTPVPAPAERLPQNRLHGDPHPGCDWVASPIKGCAVCGWKWKVA